MHQTEVQFDAREKPMDKQTTGKSKKKWFGYILFGILVTLLFLYYRFPSDAFEDYLQDRVEKMNTQFTLSVDKVAPSMTFGLRFIGARLYYKTNREKPVFETEKLLVRPSILSVFRKEWRFCFNALVYKGVVEGCSSVEKKKKDAPFQTTVALKGIPMGADDSLKDIIGRNLEGTLNGNITFRGEPKSLMSGTGEVDLRLSDGRIGLEQPILNLDGIGFHEVLIKMTLENRRINLTRVALRGTNMNGSLSGVVILNNDISRSSLNLRGTLEPFAEFIKDLTDSPDTVRLIRQRMNRGKITFAIRGTLAEPSFRFL